MDNLVAWIVIILFVLWILWGIGKAVWNWLPSGFPKSSQKASLKKMKERPGKKETLGDVNEKYALGFLNRALTPEEIERANFWMKEAKRARAHEAGQKS